MLNLFVAVSIIIIQLLIISMFYRYYKTILHPTVFIQSYFTVQIILALIVFREHDFEFYGILWIMFALFLFSIGGLLASEIIKNKSIQINKNFYTINSKLAKYFLIISIVFGFLYSLEFSFQQGFSIKALFNLEALLELNHEMAVERYTGSGIKPSKISRILLVFVYFSPLIAGFNFTFFKDAKLKRLCILSILPALLALMINNTKAVLIGAVFLFLSGYFASLVKLNKGLPKLSFKKMLVIIILGLIFLGTLYLSMMMRIGRFDLSLVDIVNKKFILYALGHVPAFDIWFTNNATSIDYHFGTRTFCGIVDFLGISERVQGVYTDRVYWSTFSTNVYTIFRPFIEDFGPYLGLAIMLFLGFFMNWIFTIARSGKRINGGTVLLSAFYFYVLYGFITSVWAYMSYTLSFLLFAMYVHLLSKKKGEYKNSDVEVSMCVNKNTI